MVRGKVDSTTSIHIGRLVILSHKLLLPPTIPQKLIKYGYGTNGWDTHLSSSWKKCFPHCLAKLNPMIFIVRSVSLQHHRVPFPIRNKKETSPFSLIHTNVWGPSRILNISGSRWFATFIDDCTRTTWFYLLKSK